MKKVGFIIHGLLVGGAEKFFINVVNDLNILGIQPLVILLTDNNPLIDELNTQVETIILRKKYKYDFTIPREIKKIIIENEIEQVFCIETYSLFLAKLFFLFNRSRKFYLSIHCLVPRSFYDYFKNFVCIRCFGKNDEILFVCKNQKIYLEKKYSFSYKNSKVIYNGINVDYFNPAANIKFDNLRNQLKLKDTDILILQVAAFRQEKGHLDSIRALKILHKTFNTPAHLLIVGGGDQQYLELLEKNVRDQNLDGYIHFFGIQKDVRIFYSQANIFTLTSHSETFSLAALEAMAFGLPCSLTDVGGASEMIIEGFNGILTTPKDAESIAKSWNILLNQSFSKTEIRNKVVQNFSQQRMIDEYFNTLVN